MKKHLLNSQLFLILLCSVYASNLVADVYGGGNWEAIGLGNMTCGEFVSKTTEESYRELGAVWLSGFMSGVNFTSEDVYDITWGEDLYVLTDLVIKRCAESSEKYLSDIATEMVYKRYKSKNFTSKKDLEDK
jgi:hypothetical protein